MVVVVVIVVEVAVVVVVTESSTIDRSTCSAVLFSPQVVRPGPARTTGWPVVRAGKAESAGSVRGGADWGMAGVQVWEGAQPVCMKPLHRPVKQGIGCLVCKG